MAISIDEEGTCIRPREAPHHCHGLGSGGGLVEQRGVGNVEARQIGDHSLEIQQCLEATLADFRLIGRIGRVPSGILQDIALDHRRKVGAVVSLADERGQHLVTGCDRAHLCQHFRLSERRANIERPGLANIARDGFFNQCFKLGAFMTPSIRLTSATEDRCA